MKAKPLSRSAHAVITTILVLAVLPLLASFILKQLHSEEHARAVAHPRTTGNVCACFAPDGMDPKTVPVSATCGHPALALWGFGRAFPTMIFPSRLDSGRQDAYGLVDIVVLAGGWMPLHYYAKPELVSGFDLQSKVFTCKFI